MFIVWHKAFLQIHSGASCGGNVTSLPSTYTHTHSYRTHVSSMHGTLWIRIAWIIAVFYWLRIINIKMLFLARVHFFSCVRRRPPLMIFFVVARATDSMRYERKQRFSHSVCVCVKDRREFVACLLSKMVHNFCRIRLCLYIRRTHTPLHPHAFDELYYQYQTLSLLPKIFTQTRYGKKKQSKKRKKN